MSAVKYNLVVEKNATFNKVLIWRGQNKRPIDLNGYTAKMQVRSSVSDAVVLVELSVTNQRITLNGSRGSISLKLLAADIAAFTWTSGVYDLVLTAGDGTKIRLLEGKFTIVPGVTT